MARSGPIVVVGSANVDLTVEVPALPRPGETVLGGDLARSPGGKGANQAVALARLGAPVRFVGRVGDDAEGAWLRDVLASAGVDVELLRTTPGVPTGAATIAVATGGPARDNMIVVAPGANARVSVDDLREQRTAEALAAASAVLVQLEVPVASVAALADLVGPRGSTLLVLNPAPAPSPDQPLPRELLERVDVLVPNRSELARLVGAPEPEATEEVVALAEQLGFVGMHADVVVTLGPAGAVVVPRDGETQHVPAVPVEAVDPTGAGDAFCAALTHRLVQGDDLVAATRFAVAAGALAVREAGAQTSLPDAVAVERLLAGR